MKIGVIGLGNMGLAMALRLRELGHALLVRDLLPQREALAQAAGAEVAPNPAHMRAACSLVIVAVVDAAQCKDVLWGESGLAQPTGLDLDVMLCPTIAPADVEHIAATLQSQGLGCIDAPMSGGPARVRSGCMSLMVACQEHLYLRHLGVLQHLASRLFHISARAGDGARTKLVNNLLAAVNLAAASEALALATQLGLDATRTQEVIAASSGSSWIGSDRMPRALAGDLAARAHTILLAKDCALAVDMAATCGFNPFLGRVAAQQFRAACAAGFGELDDASLFNWAVQSRATL